MKGKLLWIAIVLLTIWAMKRYYADAGADELWWILSPTARLAGGTAGVWFAAEPGAGYLSRGHMFLIEKSCAGLNFMIAAFAMLAFVWRRRVTGFSSGALVLAGSLLTAYAAAIVVNAARITIAMWLQAHPFAAARLTPAQAHRLAGIVVYFAGLVLLHELVLRWQRGAVSWRRSV